MSTFSLTLQGPNVRDREGERVQFIRYCTNMAIAIEVRAVPDAAHPRDNRQNGGMRKVNYNVSRQLIELPGEGDQMGVNTIMDLHTHLKITDCDMDTMVMLSSHLHSDLT